MSLTHIETIELDSSQASIEFTSIPQDYDDLVVVYSLRSDRVQSTDFLVIKLNGLDGTSVALRGSGSGSGSLNRSDIYSGPIVPSVATSNTFSNGSSYISNYTSSSNKSISTDNVGENNGTFSEQTIIAGLWSNSAAITSLTLVSGNAENFVSGSTASLYGVTAGGDGTVSTA